MFYKLKVKDIKKETNDTVSIAFEIPNHCQSDFIYVSGQYITVKSNVGGEEVRRAYSLCSTPSENDFRIGVTKVEGGKMSTFLNEQLKVGEELEVMQPVGNFLIENVLTNNVAFAAGSGITPVLSMIKAVLENEPTATFTLVSNAGCDSVVTLDLTINAVLNTTDVVAACDSLTWIDGITYFASIVGPSDTLIAIGGCDSIVTLDLTIDTLDKTVTQSNDTLLANQAGAMYQWIDCGNGDTILPGDTTQMYIATVDGDYAVIVTNGACSDTSDCINVTLTGVEPISSMSRVNVYPNPTNGNAFVSLGGVGKADIIITDLTGKIMYTKNNINTTKEELPMADFAKGFYFVKVISNQQQKVIKLIRE